MKTTLLSLKAFFTICLLCLVGGVNVMAQDTETVDFTTQGYTDKKPVPEKYNGTDFQITFSKGSGGTAPTFYKNASDGDAIRLYKSNSISISSSTKKIKEISFTYGKGGSKDSGYESTSGSYSTESKKWTSSKPEEGVSSVTLTAPSTIRNYRLQQVTVTFVDGTTTPGTETETPAPTITPASKTFSESFEATISCTDAAAKIYYTLDGNTPDAKSTLYATGVTIPPKNTTLKAVAIKNGKASKVAEAVYTFKATTPDTQDSETVDFTKQGYTDKNEVSAYTGTDFQITFSIGSNSNKDNFPKYYNSSSAIRLYSGNTMTFSSSTKNIKEISFTYNSSKPGTKYKVSSGTYKYQNNSAEGTWTSEEGGVNSVTFENTGSVQYQIKNITVTFVGDPTAPKAPTINPASKTFSESFVATISCSDANAKIYYTLDGSDPKVSTTRSEYTTGIEIPAQTTTLKACAVVGEKTSSVATATYTYVHVYENIASLKAAAVSGKKYRVKFNNAVVTCTHYNNNNVYIEDNSGAIVFYKSKHGLEEGNTLNGVTDVTYGNFQGSNQLTDLDQSQLTIGTGAEIPVTDVDIATLNANMSKYESMRIRIKKAHVTTNDFATDKKATLKQGENSILLYKKGTANMDAIQNNAIVDVIGYPTIFNSTNEIYIWKGDDAVASTDKFTITPAQYGTYYTEDAFVMPEGVTGYTITEKNGESLTLNAAYPANEVVPAKTALLLKATEKPATNKEFTYTIVNSTAAAPADNLLHGSVEATETHVEGATAYYKLAQDKEEGIGFYWANANGTAFTNGANKAYLAVKGNFSQMRGFSFESMTTGINNLVANTNNSKNAVIYDLNGRRVNSLNAAKGVYIVNGKKVIVK